MGPPRDDRRARGTRNCAVAGRGARGACVVRENQIVRLLRYFAPPEAERYLRLDSRDVLVVEAMLRAGIANILVLS